MGKTAGGTVNKALLGAGIKTRQIHMHALDAVMVAEYDVIIICLRDPIQRAISAFNWRAPGARNLSAHFNFKQCGMGSHTAFYSCCRSAEEYANRLSELSNCGSIARQGECHTELDTCAYVGGMVDQLEDNKHKVFAIDAESIELDLNSISHALEWGKTFSALPRVHSFEKTDSMTHLSVAGLMNLWGFVELTGEGPLYRRLLQSFQIKRNSNALSVLPEN